MDETSGNIKLTTEGSFRTSEYPSYNGKIITALNGEAGGVRYVITDGDSRDYLQIIDLYSGKSTEYLTLPSEHGGPELIVAFLGKDDDTPSAANDLGRVVYSAGEPQGELAQLYLGLLDRTPDELGYEHWQDAVATGTSLQRVAQDILTSSEFRTSHGDIDSKSDAQFVSLLYDVVLGRTAGENEVALWTPSLAQGASRGEVAFAIASSAESVAEDAGLFADGIFVPDPIASDVARLYYGILDRAPDIAGLESWTEAVKAGISLRTVAQSFLSSPEYVRDFGSPNDADFIGDLYEGGLGRSPVAGETAAWRTALAEQSRADVALAVSQSVEAQNHHLSDIELGWHFA